MKKSTKLLFALTAGVLLAPVVSGCEGTETGETVEQKVQAVRDAIIYGELQNGLTADLELITSIEGYEDVTITYSVSEEASAYLKVEGNTLVVTRPEYGSGDVALVKGLSVTVTLGDVTLTKYFNVRVVEAVYDDGFELVASPVVGTSYKLGMVQTASKLYFTGTMNGYYGATSASGFNGADVTLETAEGGYYLTFTQSGSKKYIDVQYSSDRAHINFVIADAAGLVYEYDTTYNTLVCSLLNDEGVAVKYFLGTHGTYSTFGVEEYANVSDATYYPAHFFVAGENAVAPEAVTTIAGALEAADGTSCVIEGTVKSIDSPWSDQYGNISVTITDGTNDLYVFRMKTNVNVGDKIKVTGEIGSYNGAKQIAAGSTAVILEASSGEGGNDTPTEPTSATGYVDNGDGTATLTIDFGTDSTTLVGGEYNSEVATFDVADYTFAYLQCRGNTGYNGAPGYLMLCKDKSAVFYNTTALPGTITSIKFVTGSNASASAVYYAAVFTEVHADSISEGHEFTGKGVTSVLEVASDNSGSFFNLSLVNNGKNGQIEQIVITIKLS